jgi:hypothetical protein
MTNLNKKPLNLIVAAALGLFVSNAAVATNLNNFVKSTPQIQVSKANVINFSFAIAQDQQISVADQAVTTQSNEYFFTVNGSQLNNGIDIHTSQSNALIKISRRGDQGKALQSAALRLTQAGQQHKNLVSNVIGEEQLKQTGVFTNAAAIKLTDDVKPGTFKLSYGEPLPAKNLYVINVKEKQSVNKLEIAVQKQHFVQNESISFDALMLAKDETLTFDNISAFIKSPSGKKFAVTVKVSANGVARISASKAALNGETIESPINGLYELHVNAQADSKGQMIHRTGKIAFALAQDTADLNQLSSIKVNGTKPIANIGLTVKTAGRYEVRGILYGHDSNGQLKPMMETHSAQNFAQGEQVVNMQFDRKIMAKSGLKAPYVLQDVRLYDQTRMSRL